MRIAILGTRGIPNYYGGFEQFAEYLSVGLINLGCTVYVYNSHNHPNQVKKWNGVNIIHKYDPEHRVGTVGQFIYDLNCILHTRNQEFDIILQLGYTSSSIWNFLFPKRSILITNMDGLEWKRSKYSKLTRKFLRFAEKLAVKESNVLVSDSIGIKKYLLQEYNVSSEYIPYGATAFLDADSNCLKELGFEPYNYNLLIARLEPENSIEIIIDGVLSANGTSKLIIVANDKTKYGKYLTNKYHNNKNIVFLGPIYRMELLNNLRYYSNLYFHGHTVGGTNPSLLEAMAASALIVAHNNEFNASILEDDAYYFKTSEDIRRTINTISRNNSNSDKITANLNKIKTQFSWNKIISDYNNLFLRTKNLPTN